MTKTKRTFIAAAELLPGDVLYKHGVRIAETRAAVAVVEVRYAHSPVWAAHLPATRFHVLRKAA